MKKQKSYIKKGNLEVNQVALKVKVRVRVGGENGILKKNIKNIYNKHKYIFQTIHKECLTHQKELLI